MNALVGELDFPNLCMCSRTYLWHVTCMYRAIEAISVKWYFWRTLSKCNLFLPVIKNCNVKKNSLEAKCCLKVDDIMYVLVLILITPVFAIISYEPPHCLYRWYAPQVSSSPLLFWQCWTMMTNFSKVDAMHLYYNRSCIFMKVSYGLFI